MERVCRLEMGWKRIRHAHSNKFGSDEGDRKPFIAHMKGKIHALKWEHVCFGINVGGGGGGGVERDHDDGRVDDHTT
jgi:hypothetical protein